MKQKIILIKRTISRLLLISSCLACEYSNLDERDKVLGNYSGIQVNNYWVDTTVGFVHDTYPVLLILTKSELDSVVNLNFNEVNISKAYLFYYFGGIFKSLQNYHSPQLVLEQDSLYFFYKQGLGPYWIECFTIKN
jgi:hypothetical protein